jgi:hypothetical protein
LAPELKRVSLDRREQRVHSTLHGFAVRPSGEVEFRFGIAAFLGYIWTSQLPRSEQALPSWPFRRIDKGFTHLQTAVRHLAFKLEYAASLYGVKARDYGTGLLNWNVPVRQEEFLSILLDAVVIYLRILPDIVAAATPYFYAKGSPSSRGFREQTAWFTKTRSTFDPNYAALLAQHQEWFELLAGREERGLRDLLVHRFGKFQFPVTTAPDEQRGEVSADLITMAGYHSEADVTLARIAQGLFRFLDSYVHYFNERIRPAAGWAPLSSYDGTGCKLIDFAALPESRWLIPVINAAV